MRRCAVLAVLVLATVSGAWAQEDLSGLFPRPQEVEGWSISFDIEHYPGEKIYDLINGAGEVFVHYNFEVVAAAEYAGGEDAAIAVEIYRMKTPQDAYGIFTYNRPEGAEAVAAPQQAFVAGILGGLWKDVYYAKVYGIEEKEGVKEAVGEFIKLISSRIAGEGNLPDIFKVMEVEGLQKGSTLYLHTDLALKNLHFVSEENVLALGRDTEMVIARYVVDERDFLAFVVAYPSEAAAVKGASTYAKFLGENPEAEAAWFKQRGKALTGTWAGIEVKETQDSEYMLYDMIRKLLKQVRIYQIDK